MLQSITRCGEIKTPSYQHRWHTLNTFYHCKSIVITDGSGTVCFKGSPVISSKNKWYRKVLKNCKLNGKNPDPIFSQVSYQFK
ncbi:MAG: hypothetical protein IPQ18_14565 [Saprospiraceae bacterium]|nr:hypothetical protein [Saprospiraceae bacterium]